MTNTEYSDLFDDPIDATDWEQRVLNCGREFLPPSAITVLDGGDATPEYWEFLADQWAESLMDEGAL